MIVRLYRKPENAKWLGWLENTAGECLGFIRLNGEVQWGITNPSRKEG